MNTEAIIPTGATLTNHRADGHGGATHDVVRDGLILGVHTSERRDSTGGWIAACYHPHPEPVAILGAADAW
jgi:hypothetical protein